MTNLPGQDHLQARSGVFEAVRPGGFTASSCVPLAGLAPGAAAVALDVVGTSSYSRCVLTTGRTSALAHHQVHWASMK